MATLVTEDETRALIATKAREKSDSFWIKVGRKMSPGQLATTVATFRDAQVSHLQYPETWLPRICGGGPQFVLQVFHEEEPGAPIGGPITINVPLDNNPPRTPADIDIELVKAPNWPGPRGIVYPSADDRRSFQHQTSFSIPSSVPPSGSNAANFVPGGGQPGVGSFSNVATTNDLSRLEHDRVRVEADRERVAQARADLEQRARQMELDAVRRENDMRMKELEMRMTSAAPKTDTAQTIAMVLTAAAPILQQMIASQNEMRLAMLKQQEATQLQQQNMMQLMMARPPIDPTVEKALDRMQAMVEKSHTEAVPQTQMLHNMAEAMGMMTQTTMDMVHTAVEMNMGGREQEHPALKAIKQGIKAMSSLMEGYQASVVQKQAAPALPAPQPAQVPTPTPAPIPAASGFAGPEPVGTVVDRLEAAIKAKTDPRMVAKMFIAAIEDSDMQKALEEVGGNVNELVAQRLGGWAMADSSNVKYLGDLMKVVQSEGVAAGIFEDDDGGDSDDEDEADAETN